jgi:hypothetical protein
MKTLRLYLIVLAGLLLVGLGITLLRLPSPVNSVQAPLEVVTQVPNAPVLKVSTNAQQLYRLDPTQSEARYSVQETILQTIEGRTVVGKTKGISGDILIDSETFTNSQLLIATCAMTEFAKGFSSPPTIPKPFSFQKNCLAYQRSSSQIKRITFKSKGI